MDALSRLTIIAKTLPVVLCVAFAAGGQSPRNGPVATPGVPVAPVHPFREMVHGVTVQDPYRWMEDLKSAETTEWVARQSAHARTWLDSLPMRSAFLARVRATTGPTTGIYDVQRAGSWLIYLRQTPSDPVPVLCARLGPSGNERTLVNPAKDAVAGAHRSIDFVVPSADGAWIAYGSSLGGSENSEIRVVATATGLTLTDRIPRANFGEVAWESDGSAFYYAQLPDVGKNAPDAQRLQNISNYRHVLRTDVATDLKVIGAGLSSRLLMRPDDVAHIRIIPGDARAFVSVTHGTAREIALYTVALTALRAPDAPWRQLVAASDDVVDYAVHGDDLFLLSQHERSLSRLLKASVSESSTATSTTILGSATTQLHGIWSAKDGVYVQAADGGTGALFRIPFATGNATRVTLPFTGSVYVTSANTGTDGVVFVMESWTESPRVFGFDPTRNHVVDTRLMRSNALDYSGVVAEETHAEASDGSAIPVSIIHARHFVKNGAHPAIIEVYGSYGTTLSPNYDPARLAWIERGGIFAIAHVRGGGENGAAWHEAGKGATKHNSWTDFIAVAEHLTRNGYADARHLAGETRSAGGIVLGRVITERPDLLAAAVFHSAVMNTLRLEAMQAGPANVPEFGSVADSAGFANLLAMDATQHIVRATNYPAVLFTAGANDSRVAPWQSAKLAAHLQAATISGRPVLLYVQGDAGHGPGSTRRQIGADLADAYAFIAAAMK
ncbi:MAG: prolyl oligopeptidase family serine peptidase [bacterium]